MTRYLQDMACCYECDSWIDARGFGAPDPLPPCPRCGSTKVSLFPPGPDAFPPVAGLVDALRTAGLEVAVEGSDAPDGAVEIRSFDEMGSTVLHGGPHEITLVVSAPRWPDGAWTVSVVLRSPPLPSEPDTDAVRAFESEMRERFEGLGLRFGTPRPEVDMTGAWLVGGNAGADFPDLPSLAERVAKLWQLDPVI